MTNRLLRDRARCAVILVVLTLVPLCGAIAHGAQSQAAAQTPSRTDTGAGSGAGGSQESDEATFKAVVANSWWYYALVTLLFGATVLPIASAMVASVWRGVTGPNQGELPLGLPVGTVRSFLAYTLVVYLGFYILASVLSLSNFPPPEFLTGVVATVIGFYFGSRSDAAPASPTPTPLPVAGHGVVQGVVKNMNGSVAPSAVVVLTLGNDPTAVVAMAQADAAGAYRLEKLAAGEYAIQAAHEGRNSAAETLTITGTEIKIVVLTLRDSRD